jgi:hypothetical protein
VIASAAKPGEAGRRRQFSGDRERGEAGRSGSAPGELLPEFSALHPGAAKQLAVLLLRHSFAPLLDY